MIDMDDPLMLQFIRMMQCRWMLPGEIRRAFDWFEHFNNVKITFEKVEDNVTR